MSIKFSTSCQGDCGCESGHAVHFLLRSSKSKCTATGPAWPTWVPHVIPRPITYSLILSSKRQNPAPQSRSAAGDYNVSRISRDTHVHRDPRTEFLLVVTQRASCTSLEALQSFTYRIDTDSENAGRRFRRLTLGACFGLEPVSLR